MSKLIEFKAPHPKGGEWRCEICKKLLMRSNNMMPLEDFMVFSAIPFRQYQSSPDYEASTAMCYCKECSKKVYNINMDGEEEK